MGPPNIMSLSLSARKCLEMAIIALMRKKEQEMKVMMKVKKCLRMAIIALMRRTKLEMKVRTKVKCLRMAREQGSQRHRWLQGCSKTVTSEARHTLIEIDLEERRIGYSISDLRGKITLHVHLILYSSSKALGLVIDLEHCLERPIGLLGVAILPSKVVGANSPNKGRN